MHNFTLASKSTHGVAVMTPKGYINDLGAERLEQTSERYLDEGVKKMIVNFSNVQFINTIGISIFTGIIQKSLESHSRLCFTNLKRIHQEIFEVVGLAKHVKIFKDEEEALSFLLKEKN